MNSSPKPDFSAWFVMQGIIATMRHPAHREAMDEQALALYQPLSDACRNVRPVARITGLLPYRWQHAISELVTNRGRLKFFCFRKKEIEKQTRKLLDEHGIKQVVVLGAGLDILSLRLAPEYSAVKFIEIDMEPSQRFKMDAFTQARMRLPENVEFIAGDLRNPLSDILARARFYDASARTVWIAEGFLMFIPEASVIRLFKEIKAASAPGSCTIFTTIRSLFPGRMLTQWIRKYYMRRQDCPYVWSITIEELADFTRKLDFTLIDTISYDQVQESHGPDKNQLSESFTEDIHIAKS